MLVVAIASQKGGSGKTTIAGHLAVEAEKVGAGPVALIDTDPQGSLAQWWNARAARSPSFAKVGVYELPSALAHLKRSGIKLVIIDTPPAISEAISLVISQTDMVILPTRPSPHDLRAVGATVDIAEKHKKPVIFVLNGATARARITGESAVALSQHGMVAPTVLHHRVDFAASMVDGRTVGEVVPKSASSKEIAELWVYIQDRLARLSQDPALAPQTKPDHLAIASLSAQDADDEADGAANHESEPMPALTVVGGTERPLAPMPIELVQTPPPPELPYLGPDRRLATERREPPPREPGYFSGSERRVSPFGRRHSDHG